jgi:branched-chain amino acid transport system permease protein
MTQFLVYLIIGITTGAIYAIAASGLVVTYATSRVFNFAHGAVGMFVAFVMYSLWVDQGWPEWLALIICVLVIAPLIGVALDVFVMRWLENASVAQRLAVTLTIFIMFEGLAQVIWGTDLRTMPPIFGPHSFSPVNGLNVTYDQAATVIIAVLVAVGLWALFNKTRIGTIMRGVVDDRALTELHGINPRMVTSLSWALGSSLAAVSAILLAPGLSMSIDALSLLVVSAYAAAIIGGLTSIPLTFTGGIALGVITSLLVGYLPPTNELVQNAASAMPFLLLFGALVVRRSELGLQRVEVFNEPPPPKARTMLTLSGVGLVLAILIAPQLSNFDALVAGSALIYAGVLLSLVLITGMAGQVSLAQWSFVGIGGVLMSHLGGGMPYWLALVLSTVISAAVGALIALPSLRLRGLYLALSTLAFAVLVDKVVFTNSHVFDTRGASIPVRSPQIFGLQADSFSSMIPLLAVVVALYAMLVLFIRRGRFGRALTAMRDAPQAASALGLNIVRTKLIVFTVSSGMAGLMGCLWGGLNHNVIASQFGYITSLTALLILTIYGVTSVTGAIVGSIFYAIFYLMVPNWINNPDLVAAIQPLGIGLAVFGLARHPEGAVAQTRASLRRGRWARKPAPSSLAAAPTASTTGS